MEVSSSNKKPELVARYYLDAVKQMGGIPKIIKADDGTEHSIIQPMHIYFREHHLITNALNRTGRRFVMIEWDGGKYFSKI